MSKLYEYIKMAVHNIMANKGRSFLTMLGIIIGIASVIAIVSVGEGTKNQMNSEIDDIGGGQIAISVSDEAQTDEEWITADDVEAIRAVDGIEGVMFRIHSVEKLPQVREIFSLYGNRVRDRMQSC